jgi:hypothetical protein
MEELDKVVKEFGRKLAEDLNKEFNKALKKGGSKNVQEASLHFDSNIVTTANSLTMQVVASDEYWKYVEKGRKKGSMPPSKAFGKKWQNKHGINPSNIIYEMTVKHYQKKGYIIGKRPKNVKSKSGVFYRNVKELPFDKASKQFSFIAAKSIKEKGIKPKPFFSKVVNENKEKDIETKIENVLGHKVDIEFNTI